MLKIALQHLHYSAKNMFLGVPRLFFWEGVLDFVVKVLFGCPRLPLPQASEPDSGATDSLPEVFMQQM